MGKKLKFDLLENGLDSIASAIEHLKRGSDRDLKRTIRDLWQGVELVLKERLRREHWALIFEHVGKANKGSYKSGDFMSVGFASCVERLRGICGIPIKQADIEELEGFQKKRGGLEHFGIEISYDAIVSSAVNVLEIVMEFIKKHLKPDELDGEAADLLQDIKTGLLELEAYVEKRMTSLEPKLKAVKTPVVTCPSCGQEALVIDGGAKCVFCDYTGDGLEAAREYVARVGGGEVGLCSECDWETVVDLHGDLSEYVCFNCGMTFPPGSFSECSSCGRSFHDDEDGVGICAECWDAKLGDD